MNPHRALEEHLLLKDNLSKPLYHEYLQSYFGDVRRKGGSYPAAKDGRASGSDFADEEQHVLSIAETYYVSTDMTALIIAASKGLDELDRFAHDLWPTDQGFLLFESPVILNDVWGLPTVFAAMTWYRRSTGRMPGTQVSMYARLGHPEDRLTQEMTDEQMAYYRANTGTLHLNHSMWINDDFRVGPAEVIAPDFYQQFATEGQVLQSATNASRIILALLMLLNQTVTSLERHNLMPTNLKRARKIKIPAQVTIVALRRTSGASRGDGESLVEWHHRWVVRGFWRNQACGPDYPLAQEIEPGKFRARIFIAPHIKGPEGMPFNPNHKIVYALKR